MKFILFVLYGLVPAALLTLPGYLLGRLEVNRLFKMRHELTGSREALVRMAGNRVFVRVMVSQAGFAFALVFSSIGATFFPFGAYLAGMSAPGMVMLLIWSIFSGKAVMRKKLDEAASPELEQQKPRC